MLVDLARKDLCHRHLELMLGSVVGTVIASTYEGCLHTELQGMRMLA